MSQFKPYQNYKKDVANHVLISIPGCKHPVWASLLKCSKKEEKMLGTKYLVCFLGWGDDPFIPFELLSADIQKKLLETLDNAVAKLNC